jgi:methyl-accepting chemotaxis protein
MARSITFRITATNFALFTLILAVVGLTVVVLQRQSDDGLVVNLSGRQRMLSQRMTHQLLGFGRLKDRGQDAEAQRQAVLLTLQVFEKTLEALDHGGPAPLDLQLATLRNVPAASQAVSAQLDRVRRVYRQYAVQARLVLDGSPRERELGQAYVLQNNTELLSEMNTAVSIMQAEAEARVKQLYYVQGAAVCLGILLFWLLSGYVQRTVVEPLDRLTALSDSISRGEVHLPVEVRGPAEFARLGASVERLRVAMKNLLPTRDANELAGL